jgi:hypothetical protein
MLYAEMFYAVTSCVQGCCFERCTDSLLIDETSEPDTVTTNVLSGWSTSRCRICCCSSAMGTTLWPVLL